MFRVEKRDRERSIEKNKQKGEKKYLYILCIMTKFNLRFNQAIFRVNWRKNNKEREKNEVIKMQRGEKSYKNEKSEESIKR